MTPGAVVDYTYVENWIEEEVEKNNWNPILLCYDPWGAGQFAQNMESKGHVVVEIRQVFGVLSEPTKEFREGIYKKTITHRKDKVLSWAIGNVVLDMDSNENIKISKKKSRERIDPVAAVINAFVQAKFVNIESGDGNISFISIHDL